jgi:aspartate racemase
MSTDDTGSRVMRTFSGSRAASTVGIVGGVGPRATALLYEQVMSRATRLLRGDHPRLLIWNLPLRSRVEDGLITGRPSASVSSEVSQLLEDVSVGLARAGADYLALPCNTLHELFRPIALRLSTSWLDMVESTAGAAAARGMRVGVIATRATRAAALYDDALRDFGATAVYPGESDQAAIERSILALVHDRRDAGLGALLSAGQSLADDVDALIVGCTDVSGLLPESLGSKPVIDSLECLADDIVVRCVEARASGSAGFPPVARRQSSDPWQRGVLWDGPAPRDPCCCHLDAPPHVPTDPGDDVLAD